MNSEPESFLSRWSRRKLAAEREAERRAETAAPEAPAGLPTKAVEDQAAGDGAAPVPVQVDGPAATTEVALPPIESLDGLRSDYQAFFQQPVDEGLRRAALKKLFADPHFNQMDMLDVYVDDYTQFEPLPDAMKLRLPSARDFLLDSERAALDAADDHLGAAGDAREGTAGPAVEGSGSATAPDVGAGEGGNAADDAAAASTSAQAPAPGAASQDAPLMSDPGRGEADSAPLANPPGKATAADHSSG
jgi:hypothetical protein